MTMSMTGIKQEQEQQQLMLARRKVSTVHTAGCTYATLIESPTHRLEAERFFSQW